MSRSHAVDVGIRLSQDNDRLSIENEALREEVERLRAELDQIRDLRRGCDGLISCTYAELLAHDAEVIERFISERLYEWPASLANQLSSEAHDYANQLRQQSKP